MYNGSVHYRLFFICDLCARYILLCLSCVWLSFHAAAAPGSPAVSAPGPGPAHDPSAAGPEPANPPRCHHLLWSLLPLLPAGLPSPAGQGGESITWRSRQPPWGGRRQVWLGGVRVQLSFYPETWIPRSEPHLAYSLSLTLANMGFNPITAAPATDPNQLHIIGRALAPASRQTTFNLFMFTILGCFFSFFFCLNCRHFLFLYLTKLQFFVFLFIRTIFYFCSLLPSSPSMSQFLLLFSFYYFFPPCHFSTHSPSLLASVLIGC